MAETQEDPGCNYPLHGPLDPKDKGAEDSWGESVTSRLLPLTQGDTVTPKALEEQLSPVRKLMGAEPPPPYRLGTAAGDPSAGQRLWLRSCLAAG